MSGYKKGYSEMHSPAYLRGCEDGDIDKRTVESCPQGWPIGPQPPNPAYPRMYLLGYHKYWDAAVPHGSCRKCRPDLHRS